MGRIIGVTSAERGQCREASAISGWRLREHRSRPWGGDVRYYSMLDDLAVGKANEHRFCVRSRIPCPAWPMNAHTSVPVTRKRAAIPAQSATTTCSCEFRSGNARWTWQRLFQSIPPGRLPWKRIVRNDVHPNLNLPLRVAIRHPQRAAAHPRSVEIIERLRAAWPEQRMSHQLPVGPSPRHGWGADLSRIKGSPAANATKLPWTRNGWAEHCGFLSRSSAD